MDVFDYSSPLALLQRLNRQYVTFSSDPEDPDKALDFCLTAWSLTDWTFHDTYPHLNNRREIDKKLGEFRDTLYPECNDLRVMGDIANGTKHFKLLSPKTDIASLDKTVENELDAVLDFAFEEPQLRLKFNDGSWVDLGDVIKNVHNFWNRRLNP